MRLVVVVLLSPVSLSCALYLLYPHPLLSIVQLAYSVVTWYRNCHLRLPLSHAFPCPTPILSLQAYSPSPSPTQHTPPPHLVRSAMLHSLYLTPLVMLNSNVILCCMLCVDQAGPCLFHLYLCSVFALQDCPPTPPALFPIPGVSVHNLELPIKFIHCPIQHAHTCVRP